ncbi:MAG: MFS transporter [Thermoleophilia bacterium]|nr:MFS transporter [Thermoleophilia bacterium]
MRLLRSTVRALDPGLPRPVWLLQAGGLANMFGNGLVVPFLIIYLHNVRGVSLGVAGLVAASNAAVALVSGPVGGALADRVGPRRTLTASLVIMAGAYALFPLIREPWHAFTLNALAGVGSGAFWPSQGSLLTKLSPRDRRHAAFAQQRVTMNLGLGLGALVGGVIAAADRPESFTMLFALDAVTFLAFAFLLRRVPAPPVGGAYEEAARSGGGFGAVLRDRPFMAFMGLNTIVIAASIAPFSELFPVFAKGEAGVSEGGIGLIFFLNTLTVVLVQLPVARLAEGHRRMRALAAMAVLFACTWLLVLAGGLWLEAAAATVLFAAAFVVFALGQCLHGTVQGPLVSDLAPPRLLGRYMALSASSWQVAFVIGPAAGGFILEAEPFALWPLAAVLCLVVAGGALALERTLPPGVRRTPRRVPAFGEPAPVPAPGVVSEPSG